MTNFNIPPYYDDYDEAKGYYKILFRPSVAIQARELNQMQTMLQKQIERFGSHIFKEGSIVVGGAFDLEQDVSYIKAISVSPSSASLSNLVGKVVVGQTTGIQAIVKAVDYDSGNNIYTIMLRYLSASINSEVFLNEEFVNTLEDVSLGFTVVPSTIPDYYGRGTTFSIGQGVVFSRGYFLAFPAQTLIVDAYSTNPTITIGLQVTENFVTELTDPSLNDNALGTTNENAPGAHRYNLDVSLATIAYKESYLDEKFIVLMHLLDGDIETTNERTQYARIYDELAKRTFDESGDYYVKGFNIRTREHLDTGENEGVYTANDGGDSTKLSIDIEPGTAYVKGYEVNKLITNHVVTDKATTYTFVNNQLVNARTGGYFLINEIVGSVDHDEGFIVNLYDAGETRITSNKTNFDAPTGRLIGTARAKAMIYESGVLGHPEARMRFYIYDYTMNPGYILSDVKGIGCVDSPNQFFADVVLTTYYAANGSPIATVSEFYENNQNVLIFPLNADNIRTVRSNTGTVDTTFQFIRTDDKNANLISAATITATVTTTGESLAYTEGELSSAEKRELLVTLNANTLIQLPGTVTGGGAANSFVLTGTSTDFTKLSIGDRLYVASSPSNSYFINSIINSTSLTVTANINPQITSTNAVYKSLLAGDVIDLTSNGSTGATRTANVSSGILIVNLQERTTNVVPSSIPVKLTYRVERNTAAEVKKILRPNRFVKIDVDAANTTGTYNLGLSDVYKIRSIRMDNTAFSNTTGNTVTSTNVTSYFTLDNGQRDNHYDHAKIIHNGGVPGGLANNHLLVELDHFVPDYSGGFGYFSVDSYPVNDDLASGSTIFTYQIPTYISSLGNEYSLRDVFDFRPVKQATATSAETVAAATTNPASTNNFIVDSDGLRIAAPDSDITTDFSFYVARRDVVTLDKSGAFNVIKGAPSLSPLSPNIPDSVMGIANIYIPPYPSISETLARILNKPKIGCVSRKIANIRYTMREIGVMRNRIENLEYYNALTMLEKAAVDLKIVDDQGLDRFKNGYFVDGFVDHSLGDTTNPDYKVSIDKIEQVIRPFFNMDSFQYKVEPEGSTNYQRTGNLITLPYTEEVLLENKNVTTIRNIEQSVFRYIGTMELTPDGDAWCDSSTVDKTIELGNEIPISNTMTTEWGSWENYSVGYNVYDRNIGDRSGTLDPKKYLGSYTSYAAAVAATQKTPYYKNNTVIGTDKRALIQTVSTDQRTGTITSVTAGKKTEELGNFVTDVGVQPYIRPQTIEIYVKGLKPNTRFYGFFDGENMSKYITPMSGYIVSTPATLPPVVGNTVPSNTSVAEIAVIANTTIKTPLKGRTTQSGRYSKNKSFRAPKLRTGNVVSTNTITRIVAGTKAIANSTLAVGNTGTVANSTLVLANSTILPLANNSVPPTVLVPVISGAEGAEWRSNEYGELYGLLRIPDTGKRFRTGTKEVVVTDSISNAPDATTYAKTYWSATGISVQKQNTIISTTVPVVQTQTITEERQITKVEVMGPSCMAYSFKINAPPDQDGAFLTSADIWLNAKHAYLGIWFEIREMSSDGGITRTQVPGSEVWLNNDQVNLWDGTAINEEKCKTTVRFPAPIFLLNNTQYAFVIHTEGLNPDYYIWVSRLGETDVLTNKAVTGRQLTGTFFTTNNNLNYDMVPDLDLKVRFNRAKFNTGAATVILGNIETEFVNIANVAGNFAAGGETIFSSEILNFSSTSSGSNTIASTDIIRGVTSNVSANVIGISGTSYYVDYYGFLTNETFNVYDSANTSKGINGSITLVDGGLGTLRSYNIANNVMTIDNSNGKFYQNAVVYGYSSGHSARITGFDQFNYSTTTLKPYYLIFKNTLCSFEKSGWRSNPSFNSFDYYSGTSPWFPGTVDSYSGFNNEVTILSRKNELATFGNSSPNSSARVRILMSTSSDYVSPVIDIKKSQSIFVHNIINSNTSGEDGVSGGALLNKYISKPVTLADGQDAEDLIVNLTAYKPPGNDVKVWMKLRHNEDNVLFNENQWIEMSYNNTFFSSDADKNNFVELNYSIPDNYKNANGVAQYVKRTTDIYANSYWSNASGVYGINATANVIMIPNANATFTVNDEVYYGVPPTGTAIAPLTANSYYYVSFVNSTALALSTTQGGANIDITEFRTDAVGEVHTLGGDVFTGFKQYSVKIGLIGDNSANPPRVGDLRTIALQM